MIAPHDGEPPIRQRRYRRMVLKAPGVLVDDRLVCAWLARSVDPAQLDVAAPGPHRDPARRRCGHGDLGVAGSRGDVGLRAARAGAERSADDLLLLGVL